MADGTNTRPNDGIPPSWNYNPATWGQRLPIIVLAFIGGGIALYLTLFQWNAVGSIFEPLFDGGPSVAAFAIISAWEVTALIRRLNLLLGRALALLQPIFGTGTSTVNGMVCGVAIIALSLVPYPATQSFGGGWRSVWSSKQPTS